MHCRKSSLTKQEKTSMCNMTSKQTKKIHLLHFPDGNATSTRLKQRLVWAHAILCAGVQSRKTLERNRNPRGSLRHNSLLCRSPLGSNKRADGTDQVASQDCLSWAHWAVKLFNVFCLERGLLDRARLYGKFGDWSHGPRLSVSLFWLLLFWTKSHCWTCATTLCSLLSKLTCPGTCHEWRKLHTWPKHKIVTKRQVA